MSPCSVQVFSNVTPAVWNCLVQKAAGYNITITTPSGQQTKDGFTFTWDYNAASNSFKSPVLGQAVVGLLRFDQRQSNRRASPTRLPGGTTPHGMCLTICFSLWPPIWLARAHTL
jgi:hypothetical protein